MWSASWVRLRCQPIPSKLLVNKSALHKPKNYKKTDKLELKIVCPIYAHRASRVHRSSIQTRRSRRRAVSISPHIGSLPPRYKSSEL